jgi:hypothetical protein
MHKKLNIKNPKTFNEKLQWLKLYNRDPAYTMMADKYEVRKFITSKIGRNILVPLVGGPWRKFEDIDFDLLPNQFVLKCTHDSGGVVICKDKNRFDIKAAKEKINICLNRNYYWFGREWPYKNIKPQIIAENFFIDDSNIELKDYKIMVFNGKAKCSFTVSNRFLGEKFNVTFFDLNWNRLPFTRSYPASSIPIVKPYCYNEMIKYAEIISEGIPFARIDFYEIAGKVYFGEITFFPGGGMESFEPEEWDYELGSWLTLPEIKKMTPK